MYSAETLPPISIRDRLPVVEVGGYGVRCIASNVRQKDYIDWEAFHPVAGVGGEGNLLLAGVMQVEARREMEYLMGDEIIDMPLQTGDIIVGILANRHSGTSEYGDVPPEGISITEGTGIDLLAAGGIAGLCLGVPKYLGIAPTKLKAIGLLAHMDGNLADLRDFYPPWETELRGSAPIILSLGTAAEIGKTTTAKQLIHEFQKQSVGRVAAAKLAGTGRKRDIHSLKQAGAFPALDFPDVGLATTYTSQERYLPAIFTLINKINTEGNPSVIIAECGGDIIEGNIPSLLQSDVMSRVVAIVHASTDVLSIIGSLSIYRSWGILGKIPIYLTYPIHRNAVAMEARLRQFEITLPMFDPLDQADMVRVVDDIRQKAGV